MKLVVEILTGSLFHIEVEDTATIADLKRKISDQENLPEKRLKFMLKERSHNQPLMNEDDHLLLVDCGICDGCFLYLFFNALAVEDDDPFNEEVRGESHLLDSKEKVES